MFTIWTREFGSLQWDEMMTGFNSIYEAFNWLVSTYESNAGFWKDLRDIRVGLHQ